MANATVLSIRLGRPIFDKKFKYKFVALLSFFTLPSEYSRSFKFCKYNAQKAWDFREFDLPMTGSEEVLLSCERMGYSFIFQQNLI